MTKAQLKFWNRKKFKGTAALKRKINPTRVPIEGKQSMRWLANPPSCSTSSKRPSSIASSPTGGASSRC